MAIDVVVVVVFNPLKRLFDDDLQRVSNIAQTSGIVQRAQDSFDWNYGERTIKYLRQSDRYLLLFFVALRCEFGFELLKNIIICNS